MTTTHSFKIFQNFIRHVVIGYNPVVTSHQGDYKSLPSQRRR